MILTVTYILTFTCNSGHDFSLAQIPIPNYRYPVDSSTQWCVWNRIHNISFLLSFIFLTSVNGITVLLVTQFRNCKHLPLFPHASLPTHRHFHIVSNWSFAYNILSTVETYSSFGSNFINPRSFSAHLNKWFHIPADFHSIMVRNFGYNCLIYISILQLATNSLKADCSSVPST